MRVGVTDFYTNTGPKCHSFEQNKNYFEFLVSLMQVAQESTEAHCACFLVSFLSVMVSSQCPYSFI